MGMSSYVMDCEDQFINSVNLRIDQCSTVGELVNALTRDNCFADIAHMDAVEQLEFVEALWIDSQIESMDDAEELFCERVNERIGECEDIGELLETLEKDHSMLLISHMSDSEKLEFVEELWNMFWQNYS